MEALSVNCKFVRESLSAYIDRELPSADFYAVRAHLSECFECHSEEQELRSLKNLLSAGAVPEPSSDFEERLLRSIHIAPLPARRDYTRTAGPVLVFASVAAASMFAVLHFISPPSANESGPVYIARDMASDVRRDQVYEAAASDPLFGAPMVTAADYGR
jgi:anti-sigma factor RsiW